MDADQYKSDENYWSRPFEAVSQIVKSIVRWLVWFFLQSRKKTEKKPASILEVKSATEPQVSRYSGSNQS